MGLFSGILSLVIVVATAQGAEAVKDIPAEAIVRSAPGYPYSCRPSGDEAAPSQRVTVNFTVNRDGETENVRVVDSTDECFEESAIAAARRWRYEPRKVGGVRASQPDVEVAIIYRWEGVSELQEFDARPIERQAPRYPAGCRASSRDRQYVLLEFDVNTEGETENIKIVESTRKCFEQTSIRAVEKWKYEPRVVEGEPVKRTGVQTQITFVIADDVNRDFRKRVRSRLLGVQRLLRRDHTDEALAKLEEIEAEYGDSFSRSEARSFHQIRAAARIESGDYKGALDDLLLVRQYGPTPESLEAIDKTIIQLEDAIAVREAMAAQKPESENTPEDGGRAEENEN